MNKELKTIITITKQVNKLLMKKFQHLHDADIQRKKHGEIVTAADYAANEYITKELLKAFPDYSIISEEAEEIVRTDSKTWYVDPLDGTTNFSYGFMEFATCLGLENQGDILLGTIGLPVLNKVYHTQKGKGAWCDNKKISVSKVKDMPEAMVLVCRGHSSRGRQRYYKFARKFMKKTAGHTRHFASAGIELIAVASGQADACVMANINPWDVIGGVLLIREAGGKVTNWQGKNWTLEDNTMVSSNGLVHEKIIVLTKDAV